MAVYINGFEIDVFESEEHSLPNSITSDPVEEGANTSDNIRVMNDEVTLTGIVSDYPAGALADRRPVLADNDSYSSYALDFLRQLRAAGQPVTIETSLGIHENMGLESLTIPKNATTGASLRFSAKFVQLRIVASERKTVRVLVPRASKRKNKGAQQAVTDAEPPKETKTKTRESILKKIF